jgi:hypothetical protein
VRERVAQHVVELDDGVGRRARLGRHPLAVERAVGEPAERPAGVVDQQGIGDRRPLQPLARLGRGLAGAHGRRFEQLDVAHPLEC